MSGGMSDRWQLRRERWQKAREFNKIIERSSLAHDNLYKHCKNCLRETARDPDDKSICVECGRKYD